MARSDLVKTTQTPEEMYYRRLTGVSLEIIARDNNVTRERVRQIVEKYEKETGLERALDLAKQRIIAKKDEALRKKKLKEDHIENLKLELDATILSLSIEGFSEIAIADALEIDRGYVSRALVRERGITRKNSSRIPFSTIEEMHKMALRGISHTKIAELFGYTQGSVSHALVRHREKLENTKFNDTRGNGIIPHHTEPLRKKIKDVSNEETEEMYQLSLQGLSQKKIGEKYGIGQVDVSTLLIQRKKRLSSLQS